MKVAGIACAAVLALTALAVPCYSDTFYFGSAGGGESTADGGLIAIDAGLLTLIKDVPFGNVGGAGLSMDYWVGDTDVSWQSASTEVFLMNLTPDGFQFTGGIASLGIAPGTLLWTIHPASLSLPPDGIVDYGPGNATMEIDSPLLLSGLGITGPVVATLDHLGMILDPVDRYHPSNQYYNESDVLSFEVTQVPEPGTLVPLGFGVAVLALGVAGKRARRV